jgi:hypothetical protein
VTEAALAETIAERTWKNPAELAPLDGRIRYARYDRQAMIWDCEARPGGVSAGGPFHVCLTMSKPAQIAASPALVAMWLDRYHRLAAIIEQQPQDPAVWVWAVRQKILAYLLQRYGSQITAGDLMFAEADSAQKEASPQASLPSVPDSHATIAKAAGAQLRPPSVFRSKLDRLSELNASRYKAMAEEQLKDECEKTAYRLERLVRLSSTETADSFSNAILKEQKALWVQELESIAGMIPEDHPLTDDEIIAILSDNSHQ